MRVSRTARLAGRSRAAGIRPGTEGACKGFAGAGVFAVAGMDKLDEAPAVHTVARGGDAAAFEAAEKAVDRPDEDRPAEHVHVCEHRRQIRVAAKGVDRPHARPIAPNADGARKFRGSVLQAPDLS